MDLEGFVRRGLEHDVAEPEILSELSQLIFKTKRVTPGEAEQLARAVIEEVKSTRKEIAGEFLRTLLRYYPSTVTMGEIGVGSRGEGDFFVHRKIASIASSASSAFLSPESQDDAGAVSLGSEAVVVAVDGTHSRLSDYPFIAGFHVARAALRDVLVKGARPLALFSDLHLADDGDVSKLFEFLAGVSTVCELTDVPLISGSTLRIGGDMVIGDRMVSCVGTVGIAQINHIAARRRIQAGDAILMTEGAGGGTICTTAIYSGNHEVVLETLNINFIKACEALFPLLPKIHAMTDVTNGGLRGDAEQICEEAKVGLVFSESKIKKLVNPKVYKLLKQNSVDYLGVSLDSLLIFTPQENARAITEAVSRAGVQIASIGEVVEGPQQSILMRDDGREILTPLFRESAYTPIKKMVGEQAPADVDEKKSKIEAAYRAAIQKKEAVLRRITGDGENEQQNERKNSNTQQTAFWPDRS
jgi:hydrogenase expression/formation protein